MISNSKRHPSPWLNENPHFTGKLTEIFIKNMPLISENSHYIQSINGSECAQSPRAPPKDKQRPSPHNTMRQIVDI